VKITEKIWKGVVVQCDCNASFFVNSYQPLTRCEHCGVEYPTLILLAAWFGIDASRLQSQLAQIAA